MKSSPYFCSMSVMSKVKISQNFVAFSECINFNRNNLILKKVIPGTTSTCCILFPKKSPRASLSTYRPPPIYLDLRPALVICFHAWANKLFSRDISLKNPFNLSLEDKKKHSWNFLARLVCPAFKARLRSFKWVLNSFWVNS